MVGSVDVIGSGVVSLIGRRTPVLDAVAVAAGWWWCYCYPVLWTVIAAALGKYCVVGAVENLAVPALFENCSLVSLATVVVNTVGGRCQAGDDSAINHWLN